MGGVVKPNDGQCHMDPRGQSYTHGLIQDFPSFGQISRLARENSMNVIFAVSQFSAPQYQEFARQISEFTVGILSTDSSNVVELVKNQYKVMRRLPCWP